MTISDGADAGDCSIKRADCSDALRDDPSLAFGRSDRSGARASRKTDFIALQMPMTWSLFEQNLDQTNQPGPTAQEKERKAQILLWAHLDRMVAQVPAGQMVDAAKFDQVFGENAAMIKAAGLVSIAHTQVNGKDRIALNFRSDKVAETGDFRLSHKQKVEFDFDAKTSELSQIDGLTAGKHYMWWHDATIDKVSISHDANDNSIFVGSGHWGPFSGSTTLVIGQDAQVVQLKKGQTLADAIEKINPKI